MYHVSSFARTVATGAGALLLKTLESVYTRCQTQALRAIDRDVVHPRAGRRV